MAAAVAPSSAVSVVSAASAIIGEYFTDDDPTIERATQTPPSRMSMYAAAPRRVSVATLPRARASLVLSLAPAALGGLACDQRPLL